MPFLLITRNKDKNHINTKKNYHVKFLERDNDFQVNSVVYLM